MRVGVPAWTWSTGTASADGLEVVPLVHRGLQTGGSVEVREGEWNTSWPDLLKNPVSLLLPFRSLIFNWGWGSLESSLSLAAWSRHQC